MPLSSLCPRVRPGATVNRRSRPDAWQQAVVGCGWKPDSNGPHGPLYSHFSKVDPWQNSRIMHHVPDVILAGSGRFRGLQ
jgi:hypothetical protein